MSSCAGQHSGVTIFNIHLLLDQGPYRHYVLNAIWILMNSLSMMLTKYHLHKLHKDYTRTTMDSMRINRLYSHNGGPDSQVTGECNLEMSES
jgi:hypothetical protein